MRKYSVIAIALLTLSLLLSACEMGSISLNDSKGTPVVSVGKEQIKFAIGLMASGIETVEGAINKDTIAVAAGGWKAVEFTWDGIKDGVKSISADAYTNIGNEVKQIRQALDAGDGTGAKKLLEQLRTNLNNFKDSL